MRLRCLVALAMAMATMAVLPGRAEAQPMPQRTANTDPVPEPTAKTDPVLEPTTETDPVPEPTAKTDPEPTTKIDPVPDPSTATAPLLGLAHAAQDLYDPLASAIEQRLAAIAGKGDEGDRADLAAMTAFYAERHYAPVWEGKAGPTPKAAAAIGEIKKAGDWGLDARAFALPEATAAGDAQAGAEAEVTLTAAVLKYARYARGGRIPDPTGTLSSYLDRKPQLPPAQDVLAKIAAAEAPDAVLRGLHPRHPQFEKLRQQYLALRAKPPAEVVTLPEGPTLAPGASHPNVAILRTMLKLPTPEGADPNLYDAALKAAVVAYQKGRGLNGDGYVGPGTRAVLNDIEVLKPEMLLANMEQWRWMPEDMGDLYVWDNIPEFTLRVVKNGAVIHTERIITGLPDKQTPIFSETMKKIIFRPRWNVPNSIKVKELWPSLARGGTYFSKQGLRLSQNGRPIDPESVDWSSTDIRRYDVYQPPGEKNALGNIKFAFPNKHDVYMHDTPNKNLFDQASRPFSHGCMRVRNPDQLAVTLLAEDKGWDAAKIQALIATGPENNEVPIEHAIPVHVTYFTAWVDETGALQTARDVYGHEKRIQLALAGKWEQIERGPDHLAPVKIDPDVRDAIAQGSGGFQSVGDLVKAVFGGF